MKGIGLATAFRTLTIIPFLGKESKSSATSLYWFPLVGAVLGLGYWALGALNYYLNAPLIWGVVGVTFLAFITRAFHLDGFADMADGFGGSFEKEKTLLIMKDSRIGAFGVIALILLLALKIVATATIIELGYASSLFYIPLLSRTIVVYQSVVNPYGRKEVGTASQLVSEAKGLHAVVVTVWVAAFYTLYPLVSPLHFAITVGSGLIAALYIAIKGRRRIGGVTGDLLGATVELSEAVMLLSLNLSLSLL